MVTQIILIQAPVPVLRETHREEDVRSRRTCRLVDCNPGITMAESLENVGDDKASSKILDYLDGENMNTSGIAIIEDRITTVKTRMLASREGLVQGEQLLLRWDVEEDEPIPDNALEAIYDQAIANLDSTDCVILSDYGQELIYDSGAERITEQAKKHEHIPIIGDQKLTGLHRTHEVDWIIFQSRGI